jgi:signal transduction histidine kinase
MIWYTYRVERLISTIVNERIRAYQAAEALEVALVNQKGFVSYYFMDKNPNWLRQLGEWRQIFKERLREARNYSSNDGPMLRLLHEIETRYDSYVINKDRVIDYYNKGERNQGSTLHSKVREEFFNILDICNQFKKAQEVEIRIIRDNSRKTTQHLREIAVMGLAFQLFMGIFLTFVLVVQILNPLKALAEKTEATRSSGQPVNLVKALAHNVDDLLKNAGETRHELEKSRESLAMAEKMAMVGKLAAGMAHSVRNPLTSVKMRLFSLNRTANLNENQTDDLMVISEEIDHIDTIVQNFLEFSRPPKLQMQMVSLSTVVDMMLQLLIHRLKSYDVTVTRDRKEALPQIKCDPEQMKEVFVNLVENACQAMGRGGQIVISENIADGENGKACEIRVKDNGPGMSEKILEKIFNPFFTTKEEGTGLGLSIAERIIENHGGKIRVESREGEGTCFIITLPLSS